MQINDPPTAAQMAVAIERLVNLAEDIRGIRGSQARLETVMVDVPLLKQEMEHISDAVRQLNTISEAQAVAFHQLDKRVLVLERWHKYRIAQTGIAVTLSIAAFSYGMGFLKSLTDFRDETKTRIQSLEFIVNSPALDIQPALIPDWLSLDQFRRATGLSADKALDWYQHVRAACLEFDVIGPVRIAAFLAQIGHESGGFVYTR